MGKIDKVLKVAQQNLLHRLRAQSTLYAMAFGASAHAPETEAQAKGSKIAQQLWAFTAAQYAKLSCERRESCLPGSVPADGDLLFGNEEVREFKAKHSIREMRNPKGITRASTVSADPQYSFRQLPRSSNHVTGGYRGRGQGGQWRAASQNQWKGHGGRWNWSKGKSGKGKGMFSTRTANSTGSFVTQASPGHLDSNERTPRGAADYNASYTPRLALSTSPSRALPSLSSRRIAGFCQ